MLNRVSTSHCQYVHGEFQNLNITNAYHRYDKGKISIRGKDIRMSINKRDYPTHRHKLKEWNSFI